MRRRVLVTIAAAALLLVAVGIVLGDPGQPRAGTVAHGPAAPAATSATTSAAPGATGPGSSRGGSPILIGITGVDYSGFFKKVGVDSANQPMFIGFRNLIRYVNRHGGLHGHPVDVIYHTINGAASSYADESESACAEFTQDHHVRVVLAVGVTFAFEDFTSCLAKRGVAQIDPSQWSFDAQGMASHPNLFMPDGMGEDRYAATELAVGLRQGWLSRKGALGVVYMDCPVEKRVLNGTIERIAREHHIKVVDDAIQCFSGFQDVSNDSSEIQSSILKFKSQHVTTVMVLTASEGIVVSGFASSASKQGYRPSYLLTSNAFPYANTTAGLWPASELTNMRGVGWDPLLDVGPRAPSTPAQAVCARMDPTLGGSNRNPTNDETFYGMCDAVRLLGAIVARNGSDLSVGALGTAYRAVVPSFRSAVLPNGITSAAGGRRDGASLAVPFSYKADCKCWADDGPPTPATQP